MWGIEITDVQTALQQEPDLLAYPSRPGLKGLVMAWASRFIWGRFPPGFRKTMADVDSRLPEMEIGLGVVSNHTQRFYPMSAIKPGLDDVLDRRAVRLSIGPDAIPMAVWRDDESRPAQLFARWYGFSLTYPEGEVHGSP